MSLFFLRFFGWGVRWITATIVFGLIMAAAGWFVFNKAVAGGEPVRVPNIVRQSLSEAAYMLNESGLEMGKQVHRYSDQVPEYHVLAQRPEAGKVIRTGRKVFPVVSVGPELQEVPNLVGRKLSEAKDILLQSARFEQGTEARLPHAMPRDTILGQDPPAGTKLERGGVIHFLVSDGTEEEETLLTPNLVGMTLSEVMDLEINATPILVDRADAARDVVLEQTPAAGTILGPNDQIFYKIRTDRSLPNAWHDVYVSYTIPYSWTEREVTLEVIEKDGNKWVLFPKPEHYQNGQPPKYPSGYRIGGGLAYNDEVTVDVYLDGVKVRSYYFEAGAQPIITDYGAEGEERAQT
ncbi:MAG: PASTA domain-containing protein [Candidatus Hydrogenedentes bacterium]|nr:PASTA domain-containing protein [Candidatus Hydrogenedentota bacterium]